MIKQYKLKNGLQVILAESKKSPVVSVQMWVRTGSADEQKGEEGISHFIEHLVFKGTEKYKVGEIASLVEGSGGELNAYTSFDQTVFYVTISSHFQDVALDTISQMMGFPTFDETEIDNEREVVIEEIKRGKDSPGRKLSQLLFSNAYKKHPYSIPVIGYTENIQTISPKKIQKYFQTRYVPSNMFLVVAGNFENKEISKKIDQYFGKFKAHKLKKISRKKNVRKATPIVACEKGDYQETRLQMAWKIPGIKHKDIPALDILAMILGQGDSSRLVKKLRLDEPIVNAIGASSFTPIDEGIFGISMTLDQQNLEKALSQIMLSIEEIKINGVSKTELDKAILNIESEQFYGLETVDGLSRQFGNLNFYFKDPTYFKKYIGQIKKVKSQDVERVAKRYLIAKQMTVVSLGKEDSVQMQERISRVTIPVQTKPKTGKQGPAKKEKPSRAPKTSSPIKFKKHKLTWGVTGKQAQPEKVTFKNGMSAILYESKDAPVMTVRLAQMGGSRLETEDKAGLSEIFSRSWMLGTKTLNEEDLVNLLDENAAYLSAFSGRNTVGLSGGSLSSHQELIGELLIDNLINPIFPKDGIEREKTVLQQQIKSKIDNPSSICAQNFMKTMFAKHPYSLELTGTLESTQNIGQADLTAYFKRINLAANSTISLAGNFDKKYWTDLIYKIDGLLPKGKKIEANFPVVYPAKEVKHFHELKREQTHIIVGYPGLVLHSDKKYVLQIVQAILAGQGGRLFLELRDKNSLAYSVSPMHMEGLDGGYFGAYIGCSPEKGPKAIEMMRMEFDKLCQQIVGDGELERAKRYLIGRHDIELQKASAICSSLLFDDVYGIDFRETFHAPEKLQMVTAQQIQDLCREIFSKSAVISAVGPVAPFET